MTEETQTAWEVFVSFLYELLSEASSDPERSGKASFSRTATAIVLLAALVWISRIVWTTNALPEAGSLAALGLFLSGLYGLNQLRAALTRDP